MTGAAAAAETPSRSSNFFTSCAASNRLSPKIDSSNCCRSAMSLSPKLIYRLCWPDLSSQVSSTASAPDKCLPQRLTTDNQSICFFFQAEDGIRDYKVTGVQTCALPI